MSFEERLAGAVREAVYRTYGVELDGIHDALAETGAAEDGGSRRVSPSVHHPRSRRHDHLTVHFDSRPARSRASRRTWSSSKPRGPGPE